MHAAAMFFSDAACSDVQDRKVGKNKIKKQPTFSSIILQRLPHLTVCFLQVLTCDTHSTGTHVKNEVPFRSSKKQQCIFLLNPRILLLPSGGRVGDDQHVMSMDVCGCVCVASASASLRLSLSLSPPPVCCCTATGALSLSRRSRPQRFADRAAPQATR
jgi:hypothetical protein